MKNVSILIFMTSILASNTFAKNKKQYDTNKDGKIDQEFIIDAQGNIKSYQTDRNFDGNFDEKVSIDSGQTEKLYDQNFDSKWDQKFVYTVNAHRTDFKKYKITKKNETLLFQKKISLLFQRPCSLEEFEKSIQVLDDISKDFDPVLDKLNKDTEIVKLDFYNLHKSCIDNFSGTNLEELALEPIMTKGLSCLTELAKKDTEKSYHSELATLIHKMEIYMNSSGAKTTLYCDEDFEKSDAGHTYANASVFPGTVVNGKKHPFININKNFYSKGNWFISASSKDHFSTKKLKSIIFHEFMHNLGYGHGDDIELAYACEACCFPSSIESLATSRTTKVDKEAQTDACNVCAGNYQNNLDPNYLLDLALMSQSNRFNSSRQNFYHNFQSLNFQTPPTNDSFLFTFYTQGPAFAKAFLTRLRSAGLKTANRAMSTTKEENLLNKNFDQEKMKDIKIFMDAYFILFQEKNRDKAISLINQIDIKNLPEDGDYLTKKDVAEFIQFTQ